MSETASSLNTPRKPTLRLLVVADLAIDDDGVIPIHRDDLAEVMARQVPGVALKVPSHLVAGARSDLACRLRFPGLEAFASAAIARAVPAMADLVAARSRLAGRRPEGEAELAGLLAELPESVRAGDLGARLRPPASPLAEGDAGGGLDALLAQVEVPGEGPGDAVAEVVAEIDRRLTRQAATISSAPRLAAVEAAWRGLAFLLGHVGDAPEIRVEILSAAKDEFLDAFFERVFHDEYEGASEPPLAAVVLGYPFDRSPRDFERLRDAARMGESLRIPFLASVGPGFWGVKRAGLLATLPDLIGRSRGPEYAKWNRLREEELSLYLALAVNRFLLRDGWASAEEEDAVFPWSAAAAGPKDPPLWGEGVWALAATLVRAFAAGGLRLPAQGVELEDLLCRPYGGAKSEPFPSPLEVAFSERRTFELGECGLAPLVARRGEDAARFAQLPTFHHAARYDVEAATRASYLAATLPHQVFAALASQVLQQVDRDLAPGQPDETVERVFRESFTAFLATAGGDPTAEAAAGEVTDGGSAEGEAAEGEAPPPPVVVEIADHPEEPQLRFVHVRLRPAFQVGAGDADLILGIPVPR